MRGYGRTVTIAGIVACLVYGFFRTVERHELYRVFHHFGI